MFRATTKRSNRKTHDQKSPIDFQFNILITTRNLRQIRFCLNFLLGGPIDIRSMRLNCILDGLFRDNPLVTLPYLGRPNTPITSNTVFVARIWAGQLWLSGVSLKRSSKFFGPPYKSDSKNISSTNLTPRFDKSPPKIFYEHF